MCQTNFSSKFNLSRHKKLHNAQLEKIQCDCGVLLANNHNFKKHCDSFHDGRVQRSEIIRVHNPGRKAIVVSNGTENGENGYNNHEEDSDEERGNKEQEEAGEIRYRFRSQMVCKIRGN